jgi:pyruvyltransferase
VAVRTFYWQGKRRLALRRAYRWRHGNAGDLFNAHLLGWAYPDEPVLNIDREGRRLLLVGSVAHRVLPGDVVCGIGGKSPDLPPVPGRVVVRGARGPLTLRALQRAGYDTSDVRFLADPGLVIGRLHPDLPAIAAEPGRVSFIPHFRERERYRRGTPFHFIDIDAPPYEVARQIAGSEAVYSSSLHGLIWAHALGRPAALVTPQTGEPEFKYRDYFESIGRPFAAVGSIDEVTTGSVAGRVPAAPDLTALIDSIDLPVPAELRAVRVMT